MFNRYSVAVLVREEKELGIPIRVGVNPGFTVFPKKRKRKRRRNETKSILSLLESRTFTFWSLRPEFKKQGICSYKYSRVEVV